MRVFGCVCFRRMVSQAAMRGQRVVESECRCWNPAVWLLVTLLGSIVLVAVSVLLRLGEYACGLDPCWMQGHSIQAERRSSVSLLKNTVYVIRKSFFSVFSLWFNISVKGNDVKCILKASCQ